MPSILFLLFRRLRMPLFVVIVSYAISILGFVLIPGVDEHGQTWHMGFFHAFYFVSFMGSTIGFGEIPYTFTDAQRFWTTFCIYATVFSWLYSIGSLLAVIQDAAFRRIVRQTTFMRAVKRINEPFYLICGYGETGSILVRALVSRGIHVVVIDIDPNRINDLHLEDMSFDIPGLTGDASDPNMLAAAGLSHRRCMGLIALTNDDQANLSIALSGKLLAAHLPVICRAEHDETKVNMESFGTNYVINPYDTFGDLLALAVHSPHMYALYYWLTSPGVSRIPQPLSPPRGTWLVCGYGRFGKAVCKHLNLEGIDTVIIEAAPEKTCAPEGTIVGKGTEADTLEQAGVHEAVAIVAGTDNGPDNLSILLTARDLKSDLFIVARQMLQRNTPLFEAAKPDLIIQPSKVTARKVLALIQNPLLSDFLSLARRNDDLWAHDLILRLQEATWYAPINIWSLYIAMEQAPAIVNAVSNKIPVRMRDVISDPANRDQQLAVMPLLLKRHDELHLLPAEDCELNKGDQILFAGLPRVERDMFWAARNDNTLKYIQTGIERPEGWVWQKLMPLNQK